MITVMINGDHFFSSNNQIHISPERVEIVNPGRLMFPKEEMGKRSAQRNPLMTDMVHRLGMVEKAASGLKRMRKSMKEYNLELDFEISSFLVPYSTEIKEENPTQIRRKQEGMDIGILEKNNKITSKEVFSYFSIHKDQP